MSALRRVSGLSVILPLVCLLIVALVWLPTTAAAHVSRFTTRSTPRNGNANCSNHGNQGFSYVEGYECFTGAGAYAKMSQAMPYVTHGGDEHSLAEIAVINFQSDGSVDALEEGWIVWPDHFHDDLPHLFVFRTIGSQEQGGCYTWQDKCGWVQQSQKSGHTPGDPVAVTSNPEQYGIYYNKGAWWVNYQNDWIGYFPASLWPNNRFTQYTKVEWYGEVASNSQAPCTQMGNGLFGGQNSSAKIDDMGEITSDGNQWVANADWFMTNSTYYGIGIPSNQDQHHFHSFTYGGPGAACGPLVAILTPDSGPSGTSVTATGSGWLRGSAGAGDQICAFWDTGGGSPAGCSTLQQDGTFTLTFTVPNNQSTGQHAVTIEDLDASTTQTTVTFTVT